MLHSILRDVWLEISTNRKSGGDEWTDEDTYIRDGSSRGRSISEINVLFLRRFEPFRGFSRVRNAVELRDKGDHYIKKVRRILSADLRS